MSSNAACHKFITYNLFHIYTVQGVQGTFSSEARSDNWCLHVSSKLEETQSLRNGPHI